MRRVLGFTLLELLAVIVVVSVGLAGLARMFGNTSMALVTGEGMQVTAQYAQECAETVLGTRRDSGFAAVNSTLCDPAPAGYGRTLALSTTYVGTASTACPNGSTCRDATVTVSKGAAISEVKFMLVQ